VPENGACSTPRPAANGKHEATNLRLHGIAHMRRPPDLSDKAAVPGAIEEFDLALIQVKRNDRRSEGAVPDTSNRFDDIDLEEEALSKPGLTCVYMRQDSDIDDLHAKVSR
jgi:hypothetical protein